MLGRIIGIILIISGAAIIIYAAANRIYFDNINNTLVENYEEMYENMTEETTFSLLGDLREDTEISTQALPEPAIAPPPPEKDENAFLRDLPVDVIGVITIDKIGLKAAIAEGSDYNTIKYSVGHFEGTPLPEEGGNFCILGHRSYTYGQFFNRVGELAEGDIIDINVLGKAYQYKISAIYETQPTNVSVLDNSENNEITIVTCTKDGRKRVIVKGNML